MANSWKCLTWSIQNLDTINIAVICPSNMRQTLHTCKCSWTRHIFSALAMGLKQHSWLPLPKIISNQRRQDTHFLWPWSCTSCLFLRMLDHNNTPAHCSFSMNTSWPSTTPHWFPPTLFIEFSASWLSSVHRTEKYETES